MQEVILVVHLILAVVIICLVLLQRSSGGGLGLGGGGLGEFASARSAANALTRATTICALLFFATSISLAVIAKHSGARNGLLDSYETAPAQTPISDIPGTPSTDPEAIVPPANAPTTTPDAGTVPAVVDTPAAAPAANTPEPPVPTE